MDPSSEARLNGRRLRPWSAPTIKVVGTVSDVLKGGGGKNSPSPADPGDDRKPRPEGPEK